MCEKKKVMASVIMSAYNAEKYVAEAISSILGQTFSDFEFIIIDDASTDNTGNVIKEFLDDRIILLENDRNVGLTKSLNKGLKIARGKYIIRADADDINLPDRFEKQIEFMEKNPDIMLASCSMVTFGKMRSKMLIQVAPEEIRGRLLFQSVLPHPGFIFRRALYLRGYRYDESFECSQDYEFQARVSRNYGVACMPDALVKYRISNGQVGVKKNEKQQQSSRKVMKEQFAYYGIRLSDKMIWNLQKTFWGKCEEVSFGDLIRVIIVLKMLKIGFGLQDCKEKNIICHMLDEKVREIIYYLLTASYSV